MVDEVIFFVRPRFLEKFNYLFKKTRFRLSWQNQQIWKKISKT